MTIISLNRSKRTIYSGDYVGSLGAEMQVAEVASPALVEEYKGFSIIEVYKPGSTVPRYVGRQGNVQTQSAATPADVKRIIDSQVPGESPFVAEKSAWFQPAGAAISAPQPKARMFVDPTAAVSTKKMADGTPVMISAPPPAIRTITVAPGGGGSQASAPGAQAPLIRQAAVAARTIQIGWHQVDTYKGWKIEQLDRPDANPKYRAVWGQEKTPVRDAPNMTYQDVDKTADAPRVDFTRNMPGGKGLPDSVRARKVPTEQEWRLRLEQSRKEWGKTGHVETFHGVRIYRGKRNMVGPDGKKVTVPVYYTKQKLMGVQSTKGGVMEGLGLIHGLGAEEDPTSMATVEALSLDEIKTSINEHPLAPTETPAPDEGPGPAAGNVELDILPGEAGTKPETVIFADPATKGVALFGSLALSAGALWFFTRKK